MISCKDPMPGFSSSGNGRARLPSRMKIAAWTLCIVMFEIFTRLSVAPSTIISPMPDQPEL